MKISIGSKAIPGPYGGGNAFLINLKKYFEEQGHVVINHLNDNDIDIILITNPLIDSETSTFNNFDVSNYITFINSECLVFQRINECDERKDTNKINSRLDRYNKYVDINIYVSKWIQNVFSNYEMSNKESYVVRGGPNENIFNVEDRLFWNKKEKIKIVTHHWSSNWMKGFDVYEYIDKLISQKKYKDFMEFTYIGNVPAKFSFKNSNVVSPIESFELAKELKRHHIYITASKNEPSGNHHMEGAMCGLPIMYIESGGLPEYCNKFGVQFSLSTFEESLNKIIENYEDLCKKLEDYPFTFTAAANDYLNIFETSLVRKYEIIERRNLNSKIFVKFEYFKNRIIKSLYFANVFAKKNLSRFKKRKK